MSDEEGGGGGKRGGGGGNFCDRARDKTAAHKDRREGGGKNGKKKGRRGDWDEFNEDNLNNFLVEVGDDNGDVRGGVQ